MGAFSGGLNWLLKAERGVLAGSGAGAGMHGLRKPVYGAALDRAAPGRVMAAMRSSACCTTSLCMLW